MNLDSKCNLFQLSLILRLDYVTTIAIKDQFSESGTAKQFTNEDVEKYLLKSKENSFFYSFETHEYENFFDRMIINTKYDIREEEDEWIEPKIIKLLLGLTPYEIQKLRDNKKIEFQKQIHPYRESTSKNSFTYLYKTESLKNYIEHEYGADLLCKVYPEIDYKPQFFTVSEALHFINDKGISHSQATFYRLINRSKVPAARFKEALRIPIKELKMLLQEGGL